MEKLKSLVSVIIPCYNQAQYLPDALNSILAQTHADWECFIVDDGSPDDTEKVALDWAERDKRFKYLRKDNGGLSSARNAGLSVVTGEYIQFLDADDVLNNDKFEMQLKALSGSPEFSLCISDYFASVDHDLNKAHKSRYRSPKFKSNKYLYELIMHWEISLSIPVHSFLFKSALFKDNQFHFDEGLPNHEDWDCWMRIFSLNPEVHYLDKKLATYRIQSHSLSQDPKIMKSGFISALENQKKIFAHNEIVYKWLTIRLNQIKYDVNSSNIAYARTIFILKNIFRKFKPMIPKLLLDNLRKIINKSQ